MDLRDDIAHLADELGIRDLDTVFIGPRPCRRGHDPCLRYRKTGTCVECKRINHDVNRGSNNARMRQWHADHPEYNRDAHLARHGLTFERFTELLESQDGRCAICRTEPGTRRFDVDHDHLCCPGRDSCGSCIRGLLCGTCNSKIMAAVDLMLRWGATYDWIMALPNTPDEVRWYLANYLDQV